MRQMLIDLICIAGLMILIVLFIVVRKLNKKQAVSKKLAAKEIVFLVIVSPIVLVGVGLLVVDMLKTLWGYMAPI